MSESKSDEQSINVIRGVAIDMVQAANSGHPGMPLGMAPAAHVLFSKIMNFSSANSQWPNRDRFVLSNGHGCALLYTMLHLCGYKVSMDDLKNFRQLDSLTPGHPEKGHTDGVEVTTGPLGQGIANGVGMAMAQAHAAAVYNKPNKELMNHKIFVFCGDGCLQEGVCCEAVSLAGHLKLKDLIIIYDDNQITIDGRTDLSFSEDVPARFRSYGWNTLEIKNGDSDVSGIEKIINQAKESDRPTLISLKTTIGFGSPKADTSASHGAPLGAEGVRITKENLKLNPNKSFHVPDETYNTYKEASSRGNEKEAEWQKLFAEYENEFPEEGKEFRRIFIDHKLPEGWEKVLPTYSADDKAMATRSSGGAVLNKIAEIVPEMFGGSADLAASNKTDLKCSKDFQSDSYDGRNVRFGIREFAMAAIGNGVSTYGLIPFSATFFNFITYAWGAVRLGALSQSRQIYIMTHDSIFVGEDGPTHQPIECLPLCRATPNLVTLRPADGNEVSGAYLVAMERANGPSVIVLSRQNLPHLKFTSAQSVTNGAYTLQQTVENQKADLILIATGSEVSLAVESATELEQNSINVRVVSCPSQDLFRQQSVDYRKSVLPIGIPVVSIEAASTYGWSEFAHFHIGIDTFGGSAPGKHLAKKFGFTVENVVEKSKKFMLRSQSLAAELKVPSVLGALKTQYDSNL